MSTGKVAVENCVQLHLGRTLPFGTANDAKTLQLDDSSKWNTDNKFWIGVREDKLYINIMLD